MEAAARARERNSRSLSLFLNLAVVWTRECMRPGRAVVSFDICSGCDDFYYQRIPIDLLGKSAFKSRVIDLEAFENETGRRATAGRYNAGDGIGELWSNDSQKDEDEDGDEDVILNCKLRERRLLAGMALEDSRRKEAVRE